MKQYLDLVKEVLENGNQKGDRTGTGTKSIFGHQLRFDLSKGFPMITTKKLHLKSIIHELLWFINGDTNISYLNENGVQIDDFPIPACKISELINLIDEGKVSSTAASQKIFPEMLKSQESVQEIAERLNIIQVSNEGELAGFIDEVIRSNTSEVERYKNGEKQLVGFFMGQLMKVSRGKADPKVANALLREKLNSI